MYEFDKIHVKRCWVSDVKLVTNNLHLPGPEANILYDLEGVQSAVWSLSMDNWLGEVAEKSKFRTYRLVRSRNSRGTITKSNIKWYHRSILCKLLSRILPLEIELGRF